MWADPDGSYALLLGFLGLQPAPITLRSTHKRRRRGHSRGRLCPSRRPRSSFLVGHRRDASRTRGHDLHAVASLKTCRRAIRIKRHVTNRYEELIQLDRALAGLTMPVDILLVSESEFEERASQPGTVERAARAEGQVLYAA